MYVNNSGQSLYMPISFGLTSNLSIDQNLSVGGTAAITSGLTLSSTTASSLLYGNASKVVSSVTLASNLSLTTGTLALAAALTGINSVTSTAGQPLVLATGTSGTALSIASATNIATFSAGIVGNSVTAASGSAITLTGGDSGASLVLGAGANQSSLTGGGAAVGSSANLVVGATTGVSTSAVGVPQISADSNTYASIGSLAHNTTNGNHGFLLAGKSRGTKASPTILADGDTFGEVGFIAYDGAVYRTSVSIRGVISGTPGAGDVPTQLSFGVAADGGGSPTDRLFLTPSGNLVVGTTNSETGLSGSGNLKTAGTIYVASTSAATASSAGGGALQVGANVGLSGNAGGASYFGGLINAAGTVTATQSFTATGAAASLRHLFLSTGSTARWSFTADSTAESGSNVGSDLQIRRYSDSGSSIQDAVTITRSTGRVNIVKKVTINEEGLQIQPSTAVSNSYTGPFVVGDGSTAATNVAIGGGNINAGGTGTFGGAVSVTDATEATTGGLGAIITAGGIRAAKKIVSMSNVTVQADSAAMLTFVRNGTLTLGPNTAGTPALVVSNDLIVSGTGTSTFAGAATFAGAVSVSGTTATWTSGTGSPESVKTAPVGSLYTRTDGGAGTTLYIKESGSGNTGWVAK